MDDSRAELSDELLRFLESRYALDRGDVRDLGGSLNRNLLLHKGTEQVVARVYRQSVSPGRLSDVQHARSEIDRAGVPCVEVVPALDGSPFVPFEDRLIEVERYVSHDGRMNTASRIRSGMPWLGRIHAVLRDLPLTRGGRSAGIVNHIEPDQVLEGTARGTARIRSWVGLTPDEVSLADRSDRLAAAVAAGETEFVGLLPRQVVHGDFWDNNVYFRGEEPVAVADFDFMGERTRIDDLALTLWFSDWDFDFWTAGERIAALVPLVAAYETGLGEPLTPAERAALPWAFARQPLWGIGGWVARLEVEEHARRHANETAKDVVRALLVVDEIDQWVAGFA
ncbi:phosphotransferase enzyme family protein [Flindersiella endophytica]